LRGEGGTTSGPHLKNERHPRHDVGHLFRALKNPLSSAGPLSWLRQQRSPGRCRGSLSGWPQPLAGTLPESLRTMNSYPTTNAGLISTIYFNTKPGAASVRARIISLNLCKAITR
jgi:hypothetical protein